MIRHTLAHWRDRAKANGGQPIYGRLISTASDAFLMGNLGQPNYAAAKAAVTHLTLSAAREVPALRRDGERDPAARAHAHDLARARGPAIFSKPEQGFDTFAPEHIGPLVAWLASPLAAHVSGHLIQVWGKHVRVYERADARARPRERAPMDRRRAREGARPVLREEADRRLASSCRWRERAERDRPSRSTPPLDDVRHAARRGADPRAACGGARLRRADRAGGRLRRDPGGAARPRAHRAAAGRDRRGRRVRAQPDAARPGRLGARSGSRAGASSWGSVRRCAATWSGASACRGRRRRRACATTSARCVRSSTPGSTGASFATRARATASTACSRSSARSPSSTARIPIALGAVGPQMTRVAGEVADALIAHPTQSEPGLAPRGDARTARRRRAQPRASRRQRFASIANPMTATGGTRSAVAAEREQAREVLAFTFATPAYRAVLDHHGLGDVGRRAPRAGGRGGVERAAGPVRRRGARPLRSERQLRGDPRRAPRRYAGLADGIALRLPRDPADDDRFAKVVTALRDGHPEDGPR